MKLQFIEAGEVVTTHGVRGEIKVLPWTDGPEFLCLCQRLRIGGETFQVETCRIQKTCNLLKLKGVDSMEKAQLLQGKMVEIFREDVAEDLIFAAELIGMDVFSGDKSLGKITDVLDYPGNKVYVIHGTCEYMIPAVKQFILSTDLTANRMQVRLIEGMRSDED